MNPESMLLSYERKADNSRIWFRLFITKTIFKIKIFQKIIYIND